MEYSLQTLNENSNLTSIKSLDIIEKLNLIGFEIDETFNESFITNPFIDNLKLLIKIPANREDLLNEKLFLIELSTIFWNRISPFYLYILIYLHFFYMLHIHLFLIMEIHIKFIVYIDHLLYQDIDIN